MPNEVQSQNTQQSASGNSQTGDGTNNPVSFDSYLAAHPEFKPLYEAQTLGLRTALQSERDARTAAEKAFRDQAKKAEQGSEAQKSLLEQADKFADVSRKANFMDAAHTAQVKNLGLAYIAAREAGLVRDDGTCDFAKLKAQYPELFVTNAPGNAGAGTNGGAAKFSMNDEIRRRAGRS
jgi:hypothetical protein